MQGADEAGSMGEPKRTKLSDEMSSESQSLPLSSDAAATDDGGNKAETTAAGHTSSASTEGTEHSHTANEEDTANEEGAAGDGAAIDATELEKDRACMDVREKVRRKFLVDMPEDFYQFWEFCKSLDPSHPECE